MEKVSNSSVSTNEAVTCHVASNPVSSPTVSNATESNATESNATESNATESNATESNATESNATESNATESSETKAIESTETKGIKSTESNAIDLPTECNICLEPICLTDFIGYTPCCCKRYYHQRCITTWSNNSNTCPQCRKSFNKVSLANFKKPHLVLASIDVKDKLLENPAIDYIPAQFIERYNAIASGTLAPANNDPPLGSITSVGVCSICSSSDYSSSIQNMLDCNFCGANFHVTCLGISLHQSLVNWNCPICDTFQQLVLPESTTTTQRVNQLLRNELTPSPSPNSSSRVGARSLSKARSTPNASSQARSSRQEKSRPGLIIHNDNDELDDDFLYDNDNVEQPPQNNVINGGVLLRKELKIQQNLSEEEKQSWAGFEKLRNGIESNETNLAPDTNNESKKRRRRRKKITPTEAASSPSSNDVATNAGSGRISLLLSKLRSSSSKPSQYPQLLPPTNLSESPTSLSPSSNSLCEYSGESDTQYDSDSKIVKRAKLELSLDQKIEIQKYIRNNLRPLYKGNQSSAPLIHSEDQYIKINKSTSRKIYQHILNSSVENGSMNQNLIDEIFNEIHHTKLKQIVNMYVTEELNGLKVNDD